MLTSLYWWQDGLVGDDNSSSNKHDNAYNIDNNNSNNNDSDNDVNIDNINESNGQNYDKYNYF